MDESAPRRTWTFARAAAAAAATSLSALAWVLISLGPSFDEHFDERWIYSGLLMPGAVLGGMAAERTGRRACFWIGLLLTSVPVIICLVSGIVGTGPGLERD